MDTMLLPTTNGYSEPSIAITSVNPYTFTTHAYYGTGGFSNGNYLQKFERELNFNNRKQSAFYTNYIKGVCDSIVNPVFSEEPSRSTNNELFAEFIKDCDNKGNGLSSVTETAVKFARLHGVAFVVMDNFEEVPELQGDIIADRKFPYVYIKTADSVVDFNTDEFGNLKSITFIDAVVTIDKKNYQLYRVWTEEYSQLIIKKGKKTEAYSPMKFHNLGVVPIVISRLESITNEFMSFPPFYDISRLNCAIYNVDSEITSLGRQQGFSLLVIPSDNPNPNIEVGADSVITVPTGSSITPTFISPDSSIMTVLQNRAKELKDSLLSVANVIGATAIGNGNQAKSGVALAYEFLGQTMALEKTARMAESLEEAISVLFSLYINQDVEYEVEYDSNFKPSITETKDKFEILEKLFKLNTSNVINNVAKNYLIDIIDEMFDMDDKQRDDLKNLIELESNITKIIEDDLN